MRCSIIVIVLALLSSCNSISINNNTEACCISSSTLITILPKLTENNTPQIENQNKTATHSNIYNPLPLDPNISWTYVGEVEFRFPLKGNYKELTADYYLAKCGKRLPDSVRDYYDDLHMNDMGWIHAGGTQIENTYYYEYNDSYLTISERGCSDNSNLWCINIWISK